MFKTVDDKIKAGGKVWCGYCGQYVEVSSEEEYMKHLGECERSKKV